MKTKYFILAAIAAVGLASCSSDEFLGDNSPNVVEETTVDDGSIRFGFELPNATRADIYGQAAADLLGNHFYVTGTKGTEPTTSPTTSLVFDNYLVNYAVNTAGTSESNTANWEYVGVTPDGTNYAKLGSYSQQTIKYWDFSIDQYDFLAFSTGEKKAVTGKTTATISSDEIGVTAMKYGSNLASKGVAYTFIIPDVTALKNAYISDITEVEQANYGNDVMLKFKNLGSKVRIALYETVPGYSVKDVKFYTVDNDAIKTGQTGYIAPTTTAALISAATGGIPTKGTIEVYFPHVGTNNDSEADYNKAAATVTPITISDPTDPSDPAFAFYDKAPTFGTLAAAKLVEKESAEAGDDNVFLGRTLPTATFASGEISTFYKTVFPVSNPSPLTLRVDYTLVPIDGAAETIKVYGAKAVVPATYTTWLPNYAYTYIFKISDNTNGWTSPDKTGEEGLFPITFDAVVAEATDANPEQRTITTVATPTITTYQQDHYKDASADEYSIARGKKVYVQVMDNSSSPATLYGNLNTTTSEGTARSLLFAVSKAAATEAEVMDALENQSNVDSGTGEITGRNTIKLTPDDTNIDADVEAIENGVDNNPITVTKGQAAEIDITALSAGTYAYVYDYSSSTKTTKDIYQLIDVSGGTVGSSGTTYYSLGFSAIDGGTATSENEAVDARYLYFSVTQNGTATKTYSYVSVEGKSNLPAGLKKVLKSTVLGNTVTGGSAASADTFYFFKYINNNGSYAVKVIKIVA